ncbi:MAG: pyrimidine 5'-nucleotidase [Afipia sp.]|nr:pyrimidine 5'-nucleotidase [Afipia sp.]
MQVAGPSLNIAPLHNTRFWIFDLDNTLYPAECGILDAMQERTTQFICDLLTVEYETAVEIRRSYQQDYGTALRGLAIHHGVKPEPFIEYVHDVDLSSLDSVPSLGAVIGKLPGQRIIHTNSPRRHAEAVIARLGIGGVIHGLLDIAATGYVPKPDERSYNKLIQMFGIEPKEACMFEDQERNLDRPALLGMKTVLVKSGIAAGATSSHADYVTSDLCRFLMFSVPHV